ncbi:hypothetical protein MSG28_001827 [Choristoneura fumiferana]|uniref:Uncharacterized protein n=1 Tax=Choristoneura fumiferana TaxID=7141 RepID=A0ACC0KVV9_CHOFU|nr:hypothetical protein MSG28_001827 [Choristoneura fumiferana]
MGSFSHVELLLTLCSIVHISWNKELIKAHNINGIALEIIKANPGKNLVLAPFAFRFPLCKLATVAHGDTKHELMAVLEIKKAEDTKTCFSTMYMDVGRLLESDMTMLNMIYVNYTDDISNQFMSDASSFGVMVSKIGFHYPNAAITFVNSEFDSKTYKRINDVLEQNDVNSNSSILLVNGMHFKVSHVHQPEDVPCYKGPKAQGLLERHKNSPLPRFLATLAISSVYVYQRFRYVASWENNFKVQNTKKKAFRSHNNQTSEVLLMNGVQQCLYLDDESGRYKGISLKLVNFGVSIMFLLPDISVSIDKLLSKIIHTPGALQKITKKMKWDNVNVFLPRFKIKTRLDWTEYFNQFGLKRTTNSSSTELNAILNKNTGNNMYLSQAKQKVFLDINEMGTHSQNIHAERRPLLDIGLPKLSTQNGLVLSASTAIRDLNQVVAPSCWRLRQPSPGPRTPFENLLAPSAIRPASKCPATATLVSQFSGYVDEFDLRNHQESRELPETAYNTLKEFLADRPFLFFINMMTMTEVSTEFDVISGVYYGPE